MARDLSPELSSSASSSTRSSPMLSSSSIAVCAPMPSNFSQLSASTMSSTRSSLDISLRRSTTARQERPAQRSCNSSTSLAASTISPIPEDDILQYCSGCSDDNNCCSRKNSSSSTSSSSTISESESANLDIKMTLTDLLNCESVRADKQMRLWVQARLMEAELELKRHRRRRVTPSLSDM